MRTAIKDLIKLRVRTHTHTEILLTVVETIRKHDLCFYATASFHTLVVLQHEIAVYVRVITFEIKADPFMSPTLTSVALSMAVYGKYHIMYMHNKSTGYNVLVISKKPKYL